MDDDNSTDEPGKTATDTPKNPPIDLEQERQRRRRRRRKGTNLLPGHRVEPVPVEWLWGGWLARGKIHLLAGAPGTGKTAAAMSLAATLTTGGRWPDGTPCEPADVVIWSGEDCPSDTLTPRLLACGADMRRIHFVVSQTDGNGDVRAFDPAVDADDLSDVMALMEPPPRLLVIDPIVSAVAGDSHKNAEVRRSLQPLVDLAQTRRCAVVGVSHFSKATAGRDPVERVTGSLAFGALARVILGAAKLPEGGRLLVRAKNNLGLDTDGYGYELEPCELETHPGVFGVRVLWGEAMTGTARELLGRCEPRDDEEPGAMVEAMDFLRVILADGPVPQKAIEAEAGELGHAWRTVQRAKSAIGVVSRKAGQGPWLWALRP